MPPKQKLINALKTIDAISFLFLLSITILWAIWSTGEAFHEGWYKPYWQILYSFLPFIIAFCFAVISIFYPLIGGLLIFFGGCAYIVIFTIRAAQLHAKLEYSFFIINIIIILTGIIFIFCHIFYKKIGYFETRWVFFGRNFIFKKILKIIVIASISIIIILSIGIPLLIRNLTRIPLNNFSEVKVDGNDISVTFSADGPGWYFSNKKPLIFDGKQYSGLSWNEIALFGKEPIGFEGKNYGENYNGTKGSVYYATQEDFDKYNMFRYIDFGGIQLTKEIQDCWRLPTVDEYVRLLKYREKNAGGFFDIEDEKAYYYLKPDKDGPIWAPEEMVIYYWTSTSANDNEAYDIAYNGEVRKISKIAKQDYRGYRAIRTYKISSSLIKMEIENIVIDNELKMPVILLKEYEGKRYLPIWIGVSEAYSIAVGLSQIKTPRPLTHDLILNTLESLDINIESIEITKIIFDTYFAIINLRLSDGTLLRIDSRPSDAIALAVRLDCDIFVEKDIIDTKGIEFKSKEEKERQFKNI